MKDIKLMMNFIKQTASILYGKNVFFYDDDKDKWYSRDHSGYVELETIIQWLEDRVFPLIREPDEIIDCDLCDNNCMYGLELEGNTLVVQTSEFDDYYDDFLEERIKIKYCPMCGRKLVD